MLKFSLYADGGIGQYRLVDPNRQSIQVFSFTDGRYELLVEGVGDQPVSVTGPLEVTVVPSSLVAD